MQITISQAEIYEKLNHIYLFESRGNTLGESTPPNHRRQQLNGLLHSTPELDHQPCTRTTSNFLAALNPRVRNKFSRWTNKIEKCSTYALSIVFPMHNTVSCAIPVHSYKQLCPSIMPSKSNLQSDPYIPMIQDLVYLFEFWIGFDWYKSLQLAYTCSLVPWLVSPHVVEFSKCHFLYIIIK